MSQSEYGQTIFEGSAGSVKPGNAFLTGSRVYGSPRELSEEVGASDLDLVVFVDEETADRLVEESDRVNGSGEELTPYFGSLNLIPLTDPREFLAWRRGTERCKAMAPVTRDQAVSVIIDELKKAGCYRGR